MATITAPVSLSAVAALVKPGCTDLGQLCTAQGINKWAVYKPISDPSLGPLAASAFRGSVDANNFGYYYGMKMVPSTGTIHGMHLCTFEYEQRPTGGEASPYRLTDFNGYMSTATPDLGGTPSTPLDESGFDIGVANFTVGITLLDREEGRAVNLRSIFSQTSSATLEDFYPCVLVTYGSRNAPGWAKALMPDAGSFSAPATLGQGGTSYSTPMSDCPALDGKSGTFNVWVSFFLCSALQLSANRNLADWVDIMQNTLFTGVRAIGIPDCCGLQFAVKASSAAKHGRITSVTAGSSGVSVAASLDIAYFGPYVKAGATASVRISVTAGGVTATKTVTYRVMGAGSTLTVIGTIPVFTWDSLGLAYRKGLTIRLGVEMSVDGVEADAKEMTVTME